MQTLLEMQQKAGITPRALQSRVALRTDCQQYYSLFRTLGRHRTFNPSGLQYVQITEVKALLDLAGISDRDERLKILRIVQNLDAVCIEFYAKKTTS